MHQPDKHETILRACIMNMRSGSQVQVAPALARAIKSKRTVKAMHTVLRYCRECTNENKEPGPDRP